MQIKVFKRLEGLVLGQQPSSEILEPNQALVDLLKGKGPYDLSGPPDCKNLASYQEDLVSMPPSLAGAPQLLSLLEADDRLYLEEMTERMLRPPEDVSPQPFEPYWDPQLRYNLSEIRS